MKLSKSLKISNFADDNELLIHSPYWTSLVTCESVILTVISRPMFNFSIPDSCLQVNFRLSVWSPYEYIFHSSCSWFTIFWDLEDFIWSDFWKHLNYFFKLVRVSVQLPLGFISHIFGRWFTGFWGLKN